MEITSDIIFAIQAQHLGQLSSDDEVLLEIRDTIISKVAV